MPASAQAEADFGFDRHAELSSLGGFGFEVTEPV